MNGRDLTLGIVAGLADAVEPAALVAVEVNVYDVPFVNPFTVHEPDAPVTVH